ncbi:FMR [Mytilus edulis]|uniref:FMR n=1 Tax=Mytilus edulis TaxID=6550 RepID=A0A8S3TW85_MYTED|nr:FMR [Mytilus edulis]
MVGTLSECEVYNDCCISWDSPINANEKGDICLEKFIERESNSEDEKSWWSKPQQTKDTWEELDSDEESSIITTTVDRSALLDNNSEMWTDRYLKREIPCYICKGADVHRGYTETFMVPFELMGLAIGRDGANIKKSRKIRGVRSVKNEKQPDGYRFTVIGESYKAINEARCLLECKQKAYTVPNHLAGRIIGRHGHEIKEVKDKSLVKYISIDNEKANAVVTFNIIGHTEAIERAVLMLNNKLDAIECTNKRIRRQRNESKADKKKLSSNGGRGNSFNGRNNVHRRQKQWKKSPGSKTPPEDCFVFFSKTRLLGE